MSDLTGKSATVMIEGLIDGERRGQVLADLAIGRMRTAGKLADLSRAPTGRCTEHDAALCRLHRDRIMLFNLAIAHTLLKIAYQVLKSGQPYQDLGADFYTRRESPSSAGPTCCGNWKSGNWKSSAPAAPSPLRRLPEGTAARHAGPPPGRGHGPGVRCRAPVRAQFRVSGRSAVRSCPWPPPPTRKGGASPAQTL